jgi:putative transposase
MRLLTVTHTQRWHAHHHTAGAGPLYQGRFKSLPIQTDEHLLTVCRYVERNPLRAKQVERAEQWPWSSLSRRAPAEAAPWLTPQKQWPVDAPRKWLQRVNQPQTDAEEAAMAEAIKRGRPYGSDRWVKTTAAKLNLQSTLRPRGRPRVRPIKDSRPL